MSYEIETYNVDDIKVTIGYDEAYWMYDELFIDDVHFLSNHRDYRDECTLNIDIEDVIEGNLPEGYEAVAISSYIHGRIALSLTGDSYPFNCRFDSGVFGFLVFKTGEFGDNNCGLEGFVRHWQAVLNGDIYFFTIEDETDIIESCGGFDCMDYMKEEIDSIVKGVLQSKKRQREEKLKALIKHRVPLHRRVVA